MIEVVAGIIYKGEKFLITQRNLKKLQGGLWEFPGGKVEKGETYQEALKREIKEELNAEIEVEEYFDTNIFEYPDRKIKLIVYKAKLMSDDIELLEHEDAKWISEEELGNYEFAGADRCFVEKLMEEF
ncbi:MAG: (deoxy)nucleoside triphosphate pyrophosphohydrolase [Clostridia bacterium]|nr:(deoxy)nucleoside triphosphate pyrophosphohydrolase [Clostridia bacterium]